MKNFVLIAFALALAFSSCITQQKCMERYPPSEVDSIKTTISYVDRHILDTLKLPGQTVYIYDSLPCPELEFHKEVSKGGLKQTIHIHKGVLNSICKADSLEMVIDNLIKEKVTLIEANKTKTTKLKVNELTKTQGFLIVCGWLFWILLLLLIVGILLKVSTINRKV